MNNKTAHEKLVEIGYTHSQLREELVQNDIYTPIHISEYYEKGMFDYICFSRTEKNYKLGHYVCVDIELSRILTQYLEELENDK